MGRRNKGTSRGQRAATQLRRQGMAEEERQRQKAKMAAVIRALGDVPIEDAHQTVFSVLRSIEVSMEDQGMEVPMYVEHRVSEVRQDMNKDYTPCRRCQFATLDGEDAMGKIGRCTQFKFADGEPLLTCRDDGCSRGLLRPEYLKK